MKTEELNFESFLGSHLSEPFFQILAQCVSVSRMMVGARAFIESIWNSIYIPNSEGSVNE
jgi:hypothetical protein